MVSVNSFQYFASFWLIHLCYTFIKVINKLPLRQSVGFGGYFCSDKCLHNSIEPFLSFGEASRKYFLYFIIGFKISDYILT